MTVVSKSLQIQDESLLSSFDPMIETGVVFRSNDIPAEEIKAFDLEASFKRIPSKLYFRIREVSEIVGVKPYVLRFWETEFPQVQPTKSDAGQRVYGRKEVEKLILIKHLLYVERFSIEGARKRLSGVQRESFKLGKKSKALSTEKRKELETLLNDLLASLE